MHRVQHTSQTNIDKLNGERFCGVARQISRQLTGAAIRSWCYIPEEEKQKKRGCRKDM